MSSKKNQNSSISFKNSRDSKRLMDKNPYSESNLSYGSFNNQKFNHDEIIDILNSIDEENFKEESNRIILAIKNGEINLNPGEEAKLLKDISFISSLFNKDLVVDDSSVDVGSDLVVDDSSVDVGSDLVVDDSSVDVGSDLVVDDSSVDVGSDLVVDDSSVDVGSDLVVDDSSVDVGSDLVVDDSSVDVGSDLVVDDSSVDVGSDLVVDDSSVDVGSDLVVDDSSVDVGSDLVVDDSSVDVGSDLVVDDSSVDVGSDLVVDDSSVDVGSDLVVDDSSVDVGSDLSVDDVLVDFVGIQSEEIAIKVENLSMEYKLSQDKIDSLKEWVIRTIKRNKKGSKKITALNNLSFEITKGDRVGIIGFNGAGKSTLLKLLAGVYYPSSGNIETNGKIAPLLELGAGFDNNFTGKDNIFLNGAFLGYSEDFLKEKYDEILEFSELGDAINYHVKTYSSGMRAKLGFSIATIVEPDILLIDEILSVGDIKFQRKSADKIRSLINSGITVLLVSHSVSQIRDLCNKALWIDEGKLKMFDDVNKVCDAYVNAAALATKDQLKNINLN